MSKATKRKHVTKEVLEEYYVPENGEEIVKIIGARGNNLHEVQTAEGSVFLASMPTKFRKNIWVKRGDYVIISPIKEGNKVQGEIAYILYSKQIKYLKDENLWPSGFDDVVEKIEDNPKSSSRKIQQSTKEEGSEEDSGSDNDDDLFENPNHRQIYNYEDSESSTEEEQSDSDTGEEIDTAESNNYGDVRKLQDGIEHLEVT